MKLLMQYEPKDFMMLVRRDLIAKGIPVPADSAITFKAKKGAPTVEVEIDIDDEPPAEPPPRAALPPPLRAPEDLKEGEEGDDGSPSMEEIMAASSRLVTGTGGMKRPLMPNESLEFPKDQ